MQVVTAFCLACICAELVSRLVEAGRARRCIKGVAGLYILAVLFRQAAGLPLGNLLRPTELPPVSLEGTEQSTLQAAARQLEEILAAQCQAETGVPISLEITLVQTPQGVGADSVVLCIPADCPEKTCTLLLQRLRQELEPQTITVEEVTVP